MTPRSGHEPADPPDGHPRTERLRPRPLRDPDHRAHKAALAAELFGVAAEVVRIGRFRVHGRLGEGGMGVVYAGHDDELDRAVAIKLLHAELDEDREARARLLREAQALARLSHPNVVQIFEVGEHQGRLFVAMERVHGQSLHAWIHGPAPRTWQAALAALLAAGRGLAAAHAVGLVHRDFKPANVMLGDDGRVCVLDFGLARAQGERPATSPSPPPAPSLLGSPMTMTGGLMGTPAYMAPEQFAGARCDARSDQFSFCVALFEALYGARPQVGATVPGLLTALERRRLARPPAAQVPAWLHAAVVRGLAHDPAARWPSLQALLDELTRDHDAPRRRRRARITATFAALTVAALTVGGALGAGWLRQRNHTAACAALGDEISQVWGPEQRARLVAAAGPAAPIDPVLDGLDALAGHWRRARTGACVTPPASGPRWLDEAPRLERCFTQARDELGALVEVLTADPRSATAYDVLGFDGPDPGRCADEPWLYAGGSEYPDDPAARRHWLAIRSQQYRGALAALAGDPLAAAARLREARTAARALPAPSLVLDGLRNLADAQFAAGRRRQAWQTLTEGLALVTPHATMESATASTQAQLLLGAAAPRPRGLATFIEPIALVQHAALARARYTDPRASVDRDELPALRAWILRGTPDALATTAQIWAQLGDLARAEAYARAGLELADPRPHRSPHVDVDLWLALGQARAGLGAFDEAAAALARALALATRDPTVSPARLGFVHLALAELQLARGDLEGAARHLDAAQQRRADADADDDRFVPALALTLAELQARRGDEAGAEALLLRARGDLLASHGVTRALLVRAQTELGRLALASGRLADAELRLRDALQLDAALRGPEHPSQAAILALLGRAERARGDLLAARATLERAHTLVAGPDAAPQVRGDVRRELARTLAALGDDRARTLARDAREDYLRAPLLRPAELRELEAWLRDPAPAPRAAEEM